MLFYVCCSSTELRECVDEAISQVGYRIYITNSRTSL